MTLRKLLLASAVIAGSATGALAADQIGSWDDSLLDGAMGSVVLNNQVNTRTNWSTLNGVVDTVGGDVVLQGTAAGNMVDITTMDNTRVTSSQLVGSGATIGSNVTLDANNVWGNVGIQNTAICNGAVVSTDPVLTAVKNTQTCRAQDPYSAVTANVSNIAGNAVFQGSAIGNTFQADSNAPNFPVINSQFNNSATISNMSVNAFNVGGSVGMSSSAVGNTATIIHYSTNGH
jgi:hypothetical protein